jgi:hypothetical protein
MRSLMAVLAAATLGLATAAYAAPGKDSPTDANSGGGNDPQSKAPVIRTARTTRARAGRRLPVRADDRAPGGRSVARRLAEALIPA